MIPVPSDGNCLAWGLRLFISNRSESSTTDFTSKNAKTSHMLARKCLSHMWEEAADEPIWQWIFRHIYADVDISQPNGPAMTPTKKNKSKAQEAPVDLPTPPESKKKVARVSQTRGVPLSQPAPASPSLKGPSQKKMEALLEPGIPNVEGDFQKVMNTVPEQPHVQPASFFFDELNAPDSTEATEVPKKNKAKHERSCKAKPKPVMHQELETVKAFLAKRGMTYGVFQQVHCRIAPVKKASVCTDHGYVQFVNRMRTGTAPSCQGCLEFLTWGKVSLENFADVIKGIHPTEETFDLPQQETDESAFDSCCKYVKERKPDEIELIVEGTSEKHAVLKFRCKICTSQSQKEGKINTLGKPVMKGVYHFLERHLACPTHLANREKRRYSVPAKEGDTRQECNGCLLHT